MSLAVRAFAGSGLLLAGCADVRGSAADRSIYRVPVGVDARLLLAPPPMAGAVLERDLEAVRAAQRTRTPQQAARAEESSGVDVFLFSSVLGADFVAGRLPVTSRFFKRVMRSAKLALDATKQCFNRPRPFVMDPTIEPLEHSLASTRLPATRPPLAPAQHDDELPCTPPIPDSPYYPSYPSGHAAVGAMTAILLGEMVPERRNALFARGWEYGDARVISGVHFPSDVEAGRILGTLLVGEMQQDPEFRADLAAARSELRSVLGFR